MTVTSAMSAIYCRLKETLFQGERAASLSAAKRFLKRCSILGVSLANDSETQSRANLLREYVDRQQAEEPD